MKRYLLIFLLFNIVIGTSAQFRRSHSRYGRSSRSADSRIFPARNLAYGSNAKLSPVVARFADSLALLREDYIKKVDNIRVKRIDTNPYYYRLFVDPMVYRPSLSQAIRLAPLSQDSAVAVSGNQSLMVDSVLNDFFVRLYLEHPELVKSIDQALENTGHIRSFRDGRVQAPSVDINMSDRVKPITPDVVIEPIEAVSLKPNFWKFSADVSGKLMQNYISDNWYQGGSNYNSWMVSSTIKANYNNKQKISWENTLQMELGFQTDRNDTEHKFKTYTDYLRLTNKLGLQASKHWYYSTSLVSWTQFCPKFSANSKNAYSDFMSPFESVLSVGMDYKYNKKSFNISCALHPLSYDFKYVDRRKLLYNYGTRGHHSMETIGSNVQINMTWQVFKEMKWTSRVYYFTNLEKAQFEWENTFNFTINKYLKTELKVYPRFDDSYKSSKSNAVFQFKEYLALSFGVSL